MDVVEQEGIPWNGRGARRESRTRASEGLESDERCAKIVRTFTF